MTSPTPSTDHDAASGSAVPLSRYVVFTAIAMGGFAVDLWTKSWIFGKLGLPEPGVHHVDWIWEGYIGFQTSLNEGALFGLGQGLVLVFAVLSVIASVGIVCWLFVWREATSWWLTCALAAVMGGIFGNLYDRLGLHQEVWPPNSSRAGERIYAVRDWILLQWDVHRWPNFNIADSLLVCGAIMLVIHAFLFTHPPREKAASPKLAQRKTPA